MSPRETFTVNPIYLSTSSFYPRNYSPKHMLVNNGMDTWDCIENYVSSDIVGGSTPPAYFFTSRKYGIPFVKTSAISRDFINVNDLHYINKNYHQTKLKRSITKPYDVIYSMTGKFMGKAALCPPTLSELNMTQNSVFLRTDSIEKAAFLSIYLNSEINRIQVTRKYSITKQKYINIGKIKRLKILEYDLENYAKLMENYIVAINTYYQSISSINTIIENFNQSYSHSIESERYTFSTKTSLINPLILTPDYYRTDINELIKSVQSNTSTYHLNEDEYITGSEIGSENYLSSGIPFIRTSNILNYELDSEPNYYCSDSLFADVCQNVRKGEIIFTKDGKLGEVAIVQDESVVLSSGIVKYHPESTNERYWLFLLLASNYGKAHFMKWSVIASTMTHLRNDFFKDFLIPEITDDIMSKYIKPLNDAFDSKQEAFDKIKHIKQTVEDSYLK